MTVSAHALSSLNPVGGGPVSFGEPGDLCTRFDERRGPTGKHNVGMIVGLEERHVSDGRGGLTPLTFAWVLWSMSFKMDVWSYHGDTKIWLAPDRVRQNPQYYKVEYPKHKRR